MMASHSITVWTEWTFVDSRIIRRYSFPAHGNFIAGAQNFRQESSVARLRLMIWIVDDLVGNPVRRAGLDPAQGLILVDEARDDVSLSRRPEHVHAPAFCRKNGRSSLQTRFGVGHW